MILTNANYNTVPIHETKEDQSHRQSYASRLVIAYDAYKLPPIQIANFLKQSASKWEIFDKNDVLIKTINPVDFKINRKAYPNIINPNYFIYYNQDYTAIDPIHTDYYYIKVTVYYQTTSIYEYYTDLIYPALDLSDAIKLEYWNETDQAYGDFAIMGKDGSYQFKFTAYFMGVIGGGEYQYEDNIISRSGIDFIVSMISKKVWKFNFTTNENQMDALRICRTVDKINITYKNKVYDLNTIDFENPEWQDNGLGNVNVEFATDTIIKKLSQAKPTRGDYNNDFNNDFLI